MASINSSFVTPFCTAKPRWKRSCSGRWSATRAATVIRLRSRLDNSLRSQTSSKRTRSVSSANFGAMSPINCCAPLDFLLDADLLKEVLLKRTAPYFTLGGLPPCARQFWVSNFRARLVAFPGYAPVLFWVRRFYDQLVAGKLIHAGQIPANQRPHQRALHVICERVGVVDVVPPERRLVASSLVVHRRRPARGLRVLIHDLHRHVPIASVDQKASAVGSVNFSVCGGLFEPGQSPRTNETTGRVCRAICGAGLRHRAGRDDQDHRGHNELLHVASSLPCCSTNRRERLTINHALCGFGIALALHRNLGRRLAELAQIVGRQL